MIVKLSGVVDERLADMTVIACRGVGYGVVLPVADTGSLKLGEQTTVFIHEHIKEDAHDLYGFLSRTTLDLFRQLLSVNGVGPKSALAVINLANETLIRQAIAEGDTKFLSQASGVGKRAAERIVVDLKGKVGLMTSDHAVDFLQDSSVLTDEAVQGLVSLGFTEQDAIERLRHVDNTMSTQERIKHALKGTT
jgi:Holliday junction DNA helicase RuvA